MKRLPGILGAVLLAAAGAAADDPVPASVRFVKPDASAPLDRARVGETVGIELRYDRDPGFPAQTVELSGAGQGRVTVRPVPDQAGLYRGAFALKRRETPTSAQGGLDVVVTPGAALVATAPAAPTAGRGRMVFRVLDAAGAVDQASVSVIPAAGEPPRFPGETPFQTDTERGMVLDLPAGTYHAFLRRSRVQGPSEPHSEWIRSVEVKAGEVRLVDAPGTGLARVTFDVKEQGVHDLQRFDEVYVVRRMERYAVGAPDGYVDVLPGTYTFGYEFRGSKTVEVTVAAGESKRVVLQGETPTPGFLTLETAPLRPDHGRVVVRALNAGGSRLADAFVSIHSERWRQTYVQQPLEAWHAFDLPPDTDPYTVVVSTAEGDRRFRVDVDRTSLVVEKGKTHTLTLGGPQKLGRLAVRASALPADVQERLDWRRIQARGKLANRLLTPGRVHDVPAGEWTLVAGAGDRQVTQRAVVQPGGLTEVVLSPPPEPSVAVPVAGLSARLEVTDDRPSVRYVRSVDGRYVPVEDPLAYGESFFVEAAYPAPPDKPVMKLDLSWGSDGSAQISLYPTPEDKTLYRSARIDLQLPAREERR